MEKRYHKGVEYSVRQAGNGRWAWNINPPLSVKGFAAIAGRYAESQASAIREAIAEIDAQMERALGGSVN